MNLQTCSLSLSDRWVSEDGTDYREAVDRWEKVTGRTAPNATEPSERSKHGRRLNPKFVEWMMGLPEGYITDSSLNRGAQLKMLGNGVVPQQVELALKLLFGETL